MPPLSLPVFSKISVMVVDCLSIAIVSYAISVSVAKAFAKKNKYEIDANQVRNVIFLQPGKKHLLEIIWMFCHGGKFLETFKAGMILA